MLQGKKEYGAILRVFSKTPEQVAHNVSQVMQAVFATQRFTIDGVNPLFKKILVLVAADPAYPDCDCGETASKISAQLPSEQEQVEVIAVKNGDLFCGALNYGIATLLRANVDYGLVLSHGAKAYLREDVMLQLIKALEAGAKVTGIAIEELAQSILEGRIVNTFAVWDLVSLVSVGGFDLRASQPRKDDSTSLYLRGWSKDKGDVYYPRAGVEEIIPLVRLIRLFGPCIAPIVPKGEAKWKEPDPISDHEGYARSQKKLVTKLARQMAHASFENVDLSFIQGGVMEQYRIS